MPPVVIAAGIGAAAGIGGAVLSSSASKKAANKVADVQRSTADANNALQRETYSQNAARLDPYSNNGLVAGNALMSLLGYGGQTAPQTPQGALANQGDQTDWAGYVRANPDAMADYQMYHRDMSLADYGQYHWNADGARRDLTAFRPSSWNGVYSPTGANALSDTPPNPNNFPYAAAATGAAPTAQTPAQQAFDVFRNSTNYQFRLNEGLKSVQTSALARGLGNSGAAMKALSDYGQNTASNELGSYMDRLAQQQSTGVAAAGALAGVSTNMTNQIGANNQNAADARSNAALIAGQANGSLASSIANGVGSIGSAIFNAPRTAAAPTAAYTMPPVANLSSSLGPVGSYSHVGF